MMLWGKAINYIGVSLGFSLFIGTAILIGSLLPLIVDGLPKPLPFMTIVAGILVVLCGILFNCKAGLTREKDEEREKRKSPGHDGNRNGKAMLAGIAIAVIGGILATGFSLANALGRPQIQDACRKLAKPEWMPSVAVMFPIFLSGGVVATCYFTWQLTQKRAWGAFRTQYFGRNLLLIVAMAFCQYAASALFAYAAFKLGNFGNTVGYAIYNSTSVLVAVISGIVTNEWVHASPKARRQLYAGLSSMILGVLIITLGNALAS